MPLLLVLIPCIVLVAATVTRFRRNRLLPIFVGGIMIATGVALYVTFIPIRGRPHDEPASLGLVPPVLVGVPGAPPRGPFVVSMGVRVRACSNPVHVTIVANADNSFYRAGRTDLRGTYTFALPGPRVRAVRFDVGSNADFASPIQAPSNSPRVTAELNSYAIGGIRVDTHPSVPLGPYRAVVHGNLTYEEPVVVRFDADWLVARGLATCYLELPNIAGPQTVAAAQEIRQQASKTVEIPLQITDPRTGLTAFYDDRFELRHSQTIVGVDDGEVSASDSLPAPSVTLAGEPAWQCRVTMNFYPLASSDLNATRLSSEPTCASVAVIVLDSADSLKNLVLLLVGALIPLGLTLALLPWQVTYERGTSKSDHQAARRRRTSGSPDDDETSTPSTDDVPKVGRDLTKES